MTLHPRTLAFAGLLLLASVALAGADRAPGPLEAGLGGALPYRIGPLQVWIVPEPEVAFLCGLRLHRGPGQVVLGCYLAEQQAIISPPNVYVLLHELKHHLEGRWHP